MKKKPTKPAKKRAKTKPKVNYRNLLKAYLRRVIACEGVSMISSGSSSKDDDLPARYIAELEKIEREIEAEQP